MKTKSFFPRLLAFALTSLPLCAQAQIVIDPAPSPYKLSPDTTAPETPFVLHAYDTSFSCNTRFFDQGIRDTGDSIFLSFEDTTANTCPTCLQPVAVCPLLGTYGPSFDMPALKSGRYSVFISQFIYCPVGFACPAIVILPQLVGTLYVSEASALRFVSAQRIAAAALGQGVLSLSLPRAPAAPWNVEIASLSGRTLQSFRVEPQSGSEVRLPLSARLDNGLYFVRLTVPGEVPLTLRVLRSE